MNVVEVNHCIGKSIKYYVSIYANVRSYSSSLYDLIYYKKKKKKKKKQTIIRLINSQLMCI